MANRSVDAAMPFDVALIACGGLGMPLGAHLRATNRSAMYNGGDLQLWFGCACAARAEPNAPNKEIDLTFVRSTRAAYQSVRQAMVGPRQDEFDVCGELGATERGGDTRGRKRSRGWHVLVNRVKIAGFSGVRRIHARARYG